MLMSKLKMHLKLNGRCSLQDLAIRFQKDPGVIRDMMSHWIRKGKVSKVQLTQQCGQRCQRCDPATTEMYDWI